MALRRYFLDYRNPKVISYMTETIRRMVEDYGADYIKMDYNEDVGVGTDKDCDSWGEGLEQSAKAYLDWVDSLRKRFPNVLFETCSSGGLRMDYETLSHYSIVSTSDQCFYEKYPLIVGNILSAVLPEQAAVWSYPVHSYDRGDIKFEPDYDCVNKLVSTEQVSTNMINSFLGRMHLASHLELLSEEKYNLVLEGIDYYNSLTKDKLSSVPYLPLGFCDFNSKFVVSGFKTDKKIYLGVWNISENKTIDIPIEYDILSVNVGYPKNLDTVFNYGKNILSVDLKEPCSARFFEINIKEKI